MACRFAGCIRWQLLGIALVLAVLGIGFLAVAVDLWLTGYMGTPAAAAATAGLLVVAALAMVGVAAIVSAYRPRTVPPGRGLNAADIAELAATLIGLSQKLDVEVRSSIKPLTVAALIVGCAVGYSPALQQKLKDLIA
jgi:hypothetical protein